MKNNDRRHSMPYVFDAYGTLFDVHAAIARHGSPAMLQSAVEAAGLKDSLDVVLSVDAIRMYKPRPEVYALVTSHFAVPPAKVVFVSSNRWDVMGAATVGFRTLWVNRAGLPEE